MTANEFRSARTRLGLSQAGLGALMRCDERTVRRWEAGDREVPGPVEVLLQALEDGWRATP